MMLTCEQGDDKMDELFKRDERKIRKLFDTRLLAELLYLNYEFNNKKYHDEISGKTIFSSLQDGIKFTEQEKQEIVTNAILLLKINHNVRLIDFDNLVFEKE